MNVVPNFRFMEIVMQLFHHHLAFAIFPDLGALQLFSQIVKTADFRTFGELLPKGGSVGVVIQAHSCTKRVGSLLIGKAVTDLSGKSYLLFLFYTKKDKGNILGYKFAFDKANYNHTLKI